MPSISVCSSNIENIKIGSLRANYNAAGTRLLRYYVDLTHVKLNLHKELGAPELVILQEKVNVLVASWDKRYESFLAAGSKTAGKALADEATIAADVARNRLRNLILETLSIDDSVDWEMLKPQDRFAPTGFPEKRPEKPSPSKPLPPPTIGFFDKLFGGAKKKTEAHLEAIERLARTDAAVKAKYEKDLPEWTARMAKWDAEQQELRLAHDARKAELDSEVDELKAEWLQGDVQAINEHASMVLDASDYPEIVPKDFSLSFDKDRAMLLVEYRLPLPSSIPSAKTVRFNAATGELSETSISKTEIKEIYDTMGYQICLRTLHELFEADSPEHIKAIAFNGVVRSTDPATGIEIEAVLMSVLVEREQFLKINLAQVDPRACFKSLKGISAATLIGLSAIPPVISMNKEDKRFVDGRQVDLGDDGSINLAAMGWEDFEHLVREIFEKEFSSRGGEVRITQASSDGGVDAVAFDPDPISGGKIVIQAKRYTKTVGVSAVRDLYGTTQSEGAIKGILVTTSDYGPDAYQFAQGKPITLMSGSNLLHLLEKHGMRARINLAEARVELGLDAR